MVNLRLKIPSISEFLNNSVGRNIDTSKPLWTVGRQVSYDDLGIYQETRWYALEINKGKKGLMRSSYDLALKDVPPEHRWRLT
jgi:hypothetical protein